MTAVLEDIRLGLRSLVKRPAFTAIVVLALGLCIGANTAMFSVVDTVLLKALPFRNPGQLVYVSEQLPAVMSGLIPFSAPDYEELLRRSHSFKSMGIYHGREFEVSGIERPERLQGARVSASLFPMLGIFPKLGRNFTEKEDRDRIHVVLLSDSLWRAKFASDRRVLGQNLMLDRTPYTIVGVLGAGVIFPLRGPRENNDPAALYVPISFTKDELTGFGNMYNHSVIARLRPGVTLAQANAELKGFARLLERQIYPPAMRSFVGQFAVSATALREQVVGDVRPMLLLLFGAVGLVLLIGCADIAGLFLTQAAGRQREMCIRTALGASRPQLTRQVMVESLLLALLGGLFALALCASAGGLLVYLTGADQSSGTAVTFNGNVLLFTLTVSLGSALLFGLLPAIRASQVNVSQGIREGGRSQTPGQKQGRLLDSLVIAQFALALLLLIGAGLLLRSFSHLLATDPGFRPDHILSLSVSLPGQSYPAGSNVRSFYSRLDRALLEVPGLKAAALATSLPLHINEHRTFSIDGQPATASAPPHKTSHIWLVGDFFHAMGIPLLRGRFLDRSDTERSEPSIVVNETLARQFWPAQNPIGQRLKWGLDSSSNPWMTVVGVVGDVKDDALNKPVEPETYSPWQQVKDENLADDVTAEYRDLTIVIRTRNNPSAEAPAMARVVHSLDASLPISKVTTMDATLEDSVRSQRFQTTLLGGFAVAALVLAALGIGGVLAYSVAQRIAEIGLRMALGARRIDVLRLVIVRGMRLALTGAALGMAAAFIMTRVMTHLLYQTSPYDALTYCVAPAFLVVVALGAILVPARRAVNVDPLTALRAE